MSEGRYLTDTSPDNLRDETKEIVGFRTQTMLPTSECVCLMFLCFENLSVASGGEQFFQSQFKALKQKTRQKSFRFSRVDCNVILRQQRQLCKFS
jgi:hypothetical protein